MTSVTWKPCATLVSPFMCHIDGARMPHGGPRDTFWCEWCDGDGLPETCQYHGVPA